jgi:hypothetical protein
MLYKVNWAKGTGREEQGVWKSVIDKMPTIEAEPIRRGHWIDTGSGQECSVCHEIQYGYDNYRYYCPYCGAQTEYVQKPLARALYQGRGAQMEGQK